MTRDQRAIRDRRLYMQRTLSNYHAQVQRAEKLGIQVEYTRDQYRDIVAEALGQPCHYCKRKITADNFSGDHMTPLSRGGKADRANLQIICLQCNRVKGKADDFEYHLFLSMMNLFSAEAATDYKRRLTAGGAALRRMFGGSKNGSSKAECVSGKNYSEEVFTSNVV